MNTEILKRLDDAISSTLIGTQKTLIAMSEQPFVL